MLTRGGSIDPRAFPEEGFDLYSIPAYDTRVPERVLGADIGSTKQVVEPGDVLLSKIVPHIRRAWTVAPSAGRRLIASGEWIVFRGSVFEPAYLRHFLLSDFFHDQFMQTVAGVGGSLMRARPAFVGLLGVPLPPLDEQRRIAAILDQADALRAKRRDAIAHLDTLTQSIFLNMFGEDSTVAALGRRAKLIDLCRAPDDIRCGPFGTQLKKDAFRDNGIALWGIKNVNARFELPPWEFLDSATARRLSQYSLAPGDIVMTRKGTVGNCAVYPSEFPDGIMHSDLLRLRVDQSQVLSEFLSHQLHHSPDVARQISLVSSGAIMPGVNVTKLKQLVVSVPPLSLQERFVEHVAGASALRRTQFAHLDQLDRLFASLQDRAFKGEP